VADVKGGEDEGAAWVGKQLAVRGWVRTCRAQRTVTFVEVRGSFAFALSHPFLFEA
jgi:asparaginyl-tRNA synthetase